MPDRLDADDNSFDLGLSSHFLLLYDNLGFDFHVKAIKEMLRVCRQVRFFPLLNLDAKQTPLTRQVMEYFSMRYTVRVHRVDYEFLKGANAMLVLEKH